MAVGAAFLAVAWDWHGLQEAWDWAGIITHLSIEECASAIMAALLIYGRHHRRRRGSLLHRFAHSYRAQFAVDAVFDVVIAITTIQIMHL
jgi:hypothetical protein